MVLLKEGDLVLATALSSTFIPDIDFLLRQLVIDLQLTPTQYQKAVERYGAVGRYLEHRESPLAHLAPRIYPQGSMALETTVKPLARQEHDLDLVSQTRLSGKSPMWLYETTYNWLATNPQYRPILERYKRCIRLNYAGDFHLDVVPAEPDSRRPEPCIQVPDCRLADWTPSNPLGYVAWFKHRSTELHEGVRAMAPLPAQESPADKSTLAIAVQVIKRRRDWAFRGDQTNAPRSVLLTTLAGLIYDGEPTSLPEVVYRILVGIEQAIIAVAPSRIVVMNPTNPDESFTESFTDLSYQRFASFIRRFRGEMLELLSAVGGIPALRTTLGEMFGEERANRAILAWGERLQHRRADGTLKLGVGGLAVVGSGAPSSSSIPANTFYGE